jgi:hypothetical protein
MASLRATRKEWEASSGRLWERTSRSSGKLIFRGTMWLPHACSIIDEWYLIMHFMGSKKLYTVECPKQPSNPTESSRVFARLIASYTWSSDITQNRFEQVPIAVQKFVNQFKHCNSIDRNIPEPHRPTVSSNQFKANRWDHCEIIYITKVKTDVIVLFFSLQCASDMRPHCEGNC